MPRHRMRIKTSETLSEPTSADKEKEWAPHNGTDATAAKAKGLRRAGDDELRLLKIRHKLVSPQPVLTYFSHQPTGIETRIRMLGQPSFEPRYIEIDAGEHDGFLREVADDLLPGRKHYKLIHDFASRSEKYPYSLPKMQVQKSFVDLGNGLARIFHKRHPGPKMGNKRRVFASRGTTYIKNVATESDDNDGPKPGFDDPCWKRRHDEVASEEAAVQARRVALNKPDITNVTFQGQLLPETGILWSQITFAAEVTADKSEDCLLTIADQALRYAEQQAVHFPAAGEVLSLTVCGPIVRVWFSNPMMYGSSRGFNLEDSADLYDIVKVFALFTGPTSNHLPHWRPSAGVEGRLRMKTIETIPVPFLLEFDDIKPLEISERPLGRRTSVWSAGIVRALPVNGGADDPPQITLGKDEHIVIKTSWQFVRLREHEHNVYKHIAITEKHLVEQEEFVRDAEVAIPELVGTLCQDYQVGDELACIGDRPLAQWTTREFLFEPNDDEPPMEVRYNEQVQFTILITRCRKAQPISRFVLEEYQMVEIFRKLIKNLKHVGLLGIHYRDLNIGNILCVPDTLFCLLADFDMSRIEMKSRGCRRPNIQNSEMVETSLDDSLTGTLNFMSQHVQANGKRRMELERLRWETRKIERRVELEKQKPEAERDPPKFDQYLLRDQAERIEETSQEIAGHCHKFVDDLESMIYTMLWRLSDQNGVRRHTIGNLETLASKHRVWSIPAVVGASIIRLKRRKLMSLGQYLQHAQGIGSMDWLILNRKLILDISVAQRETQSQHATKRLESRELQAYEECDALMRTFYEEHGPQLEEGKDAGPADVGDPKQQEEGILQSIASLSIGDSSPNSAIPNRDRQSPPRQEVSQTLAGPSAEGPPVALQVPIAGGVHPQKQKLRSYSKQKKNPQFE